MTLDKIKGISQEHSDKIVNLFLPLNFGTTLILFGSRAKGTQREGSDIDLAIKGTGYTQKNRDEFMMKYDDLYLPWKLDLVIYDTLESSDLKSHIDRVGIRLL